MLDINKATDSSLVRRDPEGNLFDLASWSPLSAQRQAGAEGLTLTEVSQPILETRYRSRIEIWVRRAFLL